MSGGAFSYIYLKDVGELMNFKEEVENMARELANLGYAKDAAAETQQVLHALRQCEVIVEAATYRLGPLWKAMEWWKSGDSGEDRVKDTLRIYRSVLSAEPMGPKQDDED